MSDLIERQAAIDAMKDTFKGTMVGTRVAVDAINRLPSAESEIIRCKDCKWKQGSVCVRFADVYPFADDFCSRAERKEDE